MSEEHRKDVVDLVRACLLSSKGGVCLDQINKDYRDLVGEDIPYRKLGHSNLADFFSKARDVCRLMESNGRIIVHPVATEATTHIDNLVSHQKKATSSSSRGQKRGRFASQHHISTSAGRRPNQRSNWVPPINNNNNNNNSVHPHPRGGRRPQRTQKVGSGRLPPRSSIANSTTYRPYTSHQKLRTPSSNTSFNANSNHNNNNNANSNSNANANANNSNSNSNNNHNNNSNHANANHANHTTGTSGGSVNNNNNGNNNNNNAAANAYPLKIGTFHSAGKPNHYPRSSKSSKNANAANPAPERSYVKDLTQYFKDKELGTAPEFKTSEMGSKKMRHRTYVSSVTVEGQSYRTFPVEYNSKELAEEAAALLAIEALGLKDKSQKQTNDEESTLRQAGEINSLIADRIAEIVGDKWNGIWSTQVDVEYKAKYKEVLPPDWPRLIIPTKHRLRIDIPIENHYIVLPMKNEEGELEKLTSPSTNGAVSDAQNEFTTPPSSKTLDHSSEENVEEMMSVDGHFSEKTLPPINISDETYWDVYITLVSSPTDVVVRLLSETHYDDLTTDMELYYYDYSSKLLPVNEPLVGCLYAAKLDTDWHRVRVTNVHGIKVTCYFIDHGDEDVLSVQDLRPIHPKFLRLPPQALPVKLAGLENLADDEMALSYVRENILGRSLVAEVVSREKGADPPTLILFDTSTETDINLNKKVLELANEGNNFSGCALPSPGEEISSAYLLSVSSTGDCYVQRDSINLIDNLIDEAKDKILEAELPTNLDTNKLYLARSQISNQLCRAALLTTQVKEGKVEVNCIDHGNQEKVDLNDLREIGSVSKLLTETPHQAFKCRLANLPGNYVWTREAADKLRSLVPEEKEFSLKVISTSSGDTPEVEIYLKGQEGGANATDAESVNSMISQLKELFIVNEHDAALEGSDSGREINSEDSKTSLSPQDELLFSEIASLKGLVPPKIPEKDEYFDVTVTLAASPSNFYVQPWRQTESLEILTSEINEFYSSPSRRVNSITMDDLSEDSFFAAFHSDGFWYRIKVDRILDDQNITVKFVDYGDFTMVNLKNLQPLWPQFRNLPMQAIKAFLSDIVPVNGDWTPDDAIWFSNRSVEKQFVSVVKDISHEEDGSIKLGVSLIDVSHPKEDILIDKLLVDEKRAVYLCI